jgi:polyhydroxybutyrate depolymerase
VGDVSRNYWVHLPQQHADLALPVVINLHGGGGNALQHKRSSGMDANADSNGYIAVYPNGSGRLKDKLLTWNSGNCCGYAQQQNIDDIAFISALIDDLGKHYAIDTQRIYVAGHSNGGGMAHRLGEALPDKIAAIGAVAGVHIPSTVKGRAVPVMHIHSVDDPRALYAGGLGPAFPFTFTRIMHSAVAEALIIWVQHDGCDSTPTEREFKQVANHTARLLVYGHCRQGAEVAHWQLTGAGHGWPGGKPVLEKLTGPATTVIDANAELWRFFSRFKL